MFIRRQAFRRASLQRRPQGRQRFGGSSRRGSRRRRVVRVQVRESLFHCVNARLVDYRGTRHRQRCRGVSSDASSGRRSYSRGGCPFSVFLLVLVRDQAGRLPSFPRRVERDGRGYRPRQNNRIDGRLEYRSSVGRVRVGVVVARVERGVGPQASVSRPLIRVTRPSMGSGVKVAKYRCCTIGCAVTAARGNRATCHGSGRHWGEARRDPAGYLRIIPRKRFFLFWFYRLLLFVNVICLGIIFWSFCAIFGIFRAFASAFRRFECFFAARGWRGGGNGSSGLTDSWVSGGWWLVRSVMWVDHWCSYCQ